MGGSRAGREFSRAVVEEAFRRNWDGSRGGGYWCEWCGFTSARRAYFEVDHLIAVARGGPPTLDNACILCSACNASKGLHGFPRHGVGLAYRAPNQNMAPPCVRVRSLTWDELVAMCRRQGPFRRQPI